MTNDIQSLAPSQIHQVESAFARFVRDGVHAFDAEGEDGVRAGGTLVHEGGGDGAAGLCEGEERTDLGGRGQGEDGGVRDAGGMGFRIVLDFVLFGVESVFAEEVIDGFVVLEGCN